MLDRLLSAFRWHYSLCEPYRKICDSFGWHPDKSDSYETLPYVQTDYFKHMGRELISVPEKDIVHWLTSSSTSGKPSTVGVDRQTIRKQQQCLAATLTPIIGTERKPFIVCDSDLTGGKTLPARSAGLRGLLALSNGYSMGWHNIPDEPCVVIGFTYVVWTEFIQPRLPHQRAEFHPDSVLLHLGGWKHLEAQKVDRPTFAAGVLDVTGITNVVDLYGFTEQMGVVYPDCELGNKHGKVLIRDPLTHATVNKGLGQFFSDVPISYPGFSVLTDDIIERVDCPCGPNGFRVLGRAKGVELRGCGDVYAR